MPRRVVVDANILVKRFVPEDYSDSAAAILRDHLLGRVTAAVPSYAVIEFASALRKYVARGLLSEGDAVSAIRLLERVGVEYAPVTFDVVREALGYALKRGVTVYDACYVLLAKRYGTKVYTADEKLLRRLKGEGSVEHVRNYGSEAS